MSCPGAVLVTFFAFAVTIINCQVPLLFPDSHHDHENNGIVRIRHPVTATYISHPHAPFVAAAAPKPFIAPVARNRVRVLKPIAPPTASALIDENYGPADPYNFGFDVRDEFGNNMFRKEDSDGRGSVTGSYGYTDANGLFRLVEYIADANGFRANVKSNEPGVGPASPADIVLTAQEPPREFQNFVPSTVNPSEKLSGRSAGAQLKQGAALGVPVLLPAPFKSARARARA